jgi:hypothetical protein
MLLTRRSSAVWTDGSAYLHIGRASQRAHPKPALEPERGQTMAIESTGHSRGNPRIYELIESAPKTGKSPTIWAWPEVVDWFRIAGQPVPGPWPPHQQPRPNPEEESLPVAVAEPARPEPRREYRPSNEPASSSPPSRPSPPPARESEPAPSHGSADEPSPRHYGDADEPPRQGLGLMDI